MSIDWEENVVEKVIVNEQVVVRQVKTFQTKIIAKDTPIKAVKHFPCKLCGKYFMLQRGGLTGAGDSRSDWCASDSSAQS